MIKLESITKIYQMGANQVSALNGVSLQIDDGDYVAIMGPSGSGKSTLMHVIGLLDIPTGGRYEINGKEVGNLNEDELAALRREVVGFVFQQFNLLPRLTATENVALPLLYSNHQESSEWPLGLLKQVGLGARSSHHPNKLSGGQQQRVAIARALVNRPQIVLADEPTGNLDSASEKEILAILEELNAKGTTIVMVTHEESIANHAKRVIRMRDGVISSDERRTAATSGLSPDSPVAYWKGGFWREALEYIAQGLKSLAANKLRTGLSMLGILIGVAAVIAMLALGKGAQQEIESQLASLGSNLLVLRPAAVRVGGVAQESGATTRLLVEDARELGEGLAFVKHAAPTVNGRAQVAFLNQNWNTQITGVAPQYAQMRAAQPKIGRFFTDAENQKRSRLALLGVTVVRELFKGQNPIGEMIKINKVNFQVIGILPEKGATSWRDQDDVIVVPVFTAMHRLLGKDYVDSIDIEVNKDTDMQNAQSAILDLMHKKKRVPPSQQNGAFEIRNMAEIQAAAAESNRTMSVLLACIAAISLLVGGIGIMNIMLVSVTERTREIGLRKALGAKRRDILAQFLAESVVVSATGGLIGVGLGWSVSQALASIAGWPTVFSPASAALAFFFAAAVGVIFGIYPARKASRLNPIDALRYE